MTDATNDEASNEKRNGENGDSIVKTTVENGGTDKTDSYSHGKDADDKNTDSVLEEKIDDPEISYLNLNDESKDESEKETATSGHNMMELESKTTLPSTPDRSPRGPSSSSLSSTPDHHPSSLSSSPERLNHHHHDGDDDDDDHNDHHRGDDDDDDNDKSHPPELKVMDDDTWNQLTKRDRELSVANSIAVMDYADTVLKKRIGEATNRLNLKKNLNKFQTTLGRFQNSEFKLGRRLASGNFADIYHVSTYVPIDRESKCCTEEQKDAADHIKIKYKPNELVVKVLRGNLLLNPSLYATAAADFITEGTVLSAMDHPHIVTVLGRSVSSVEGFASGKRDSVFIVLERLHGDLTHRMRQWKERQSQNRIIVKGIAGRRDGRAAILRERVQAMVELADALVYLHERNIIHRDLKLSNVGVDARGKMKLLDFGLAKVLPPATDDNELFHLTGHTGSVRYMAPEVARAETYNLKADVYSFAILLYEVMNLEKAFQGWQPRDIQERVHMGKYRPRVSMVWPGPIKDLIKGTWSDVPAGRLSMKHVHAILLREAAELLQNADAF